MMIRYILTQLLIFLIPFAAVAQSLEECLRKARANYPEIQRYDLIRQSRDYNLSNAIRRWIPQISLSARASWQNEVPGLPEGIREVTNAQGTKYQGVDKDQYQLSVNIRQTIWDGGASSMTRRLIKAKADAEQQQINVTLYALEDRVEELYFSLLLLGTQAEQTQTSIALLQSQEEKIKSMLKHGTALPSDVDLIQAERLTTLQELQKILATKRGFQRMLSYLTGIDIGNSLVRPAPHRTKAMETARPELQLFQARELICKAEKSRFNVALHPHLSFFAQSGYGYPGFDLFLSMKNNNWRWNTMLGINVNWNLSALYTRKNDLRKIETARAQMNLDKEVFLFNNHLKAISDNEEILRMSRMIEDDENILRLRKRVRKACESKFANGVIDIHALTQALSAETQAALSKAAHEIQLLQAQYKLKRTLNH